MNAAILEAARAVLERPEATRLLEYGQAAGNSHQLTAAEAWLRRFHVQARPDNLLIAAGSQNALAVSLISLFKAGDKIAVDPYTYPNFIGLASFLHIQLVAVEGDEDGMKPQALDTLCRQSGISGVYLMPSCSNPMGIVMPMERREALARVIERHGLILVEDDASCCPGSSGRWPRPSPTGRFTSAAPPSRCAPGCGWRSWRFPRRSAPIWPPG